MIGDRNKINKQLGSSYPRYRFTQTRSREGMDILQWLYLRKYISFIFILFLFNCNNIKRKIYKNEVEKIQISKIDTFYRTTNEFTIKNEKLIGIIENHIKSVKSIYISKKSIKKIFVDINFYYNDSNVMFNIISSNSNSIHNPFYNYPFFRNEKFLGIMNYKGFNLILNGCINKSVNENRKMCNDFLNNNITILPNIKKVEFFNYVTKKNKYNPKYKEYNWYYKSIYQIKNEKFILMKIDSTTPTEYFMTLML